MTLPNLAPASVYHLPAADLDQPADVQAWLRCHPLAYDLGGKFRRCPTCEQWTGVRGCDVRALAEAGDVDAARRLHEQREWPAGTGEATTAYSGMTADYRLVTFQHDGERA